MNDSEHRVRVSGICGFVHGRNQPLGQSDEAFLYSIGTDLIVSSPTQAPGSATSTNAEKWATNSLAVSTASSGDTVAEEPEK